ncbi:MAG: hypothetical protein S4CHLAM2_15800 [Chlamydiales bacterium]|nr:hypothetical protein [Chlamydiales bacterium]
MLLGAGYVGTRLLIHWDRPEDRFIALTTTPEKQAPLEKIPRVEKVMIGSFDGVLDSCQGLIICVAPKVGSSYESTYLETAERVQHLVKERTKPLYIVYTSSTSVYGKQTEQWIDEATPPLPQSPEGKILLATEQTYLACASDAVTVCILRLGGIYGPGRELKARAARLSGKELPGSGTQPTNHSHVDEIIHAIEFCFTHQLEGIYNLVADAHPTREELYSELCTEPPTWNPNNLSMHGSNSSVSNEKIKQTGYTLLHPNLEV